jgi:hypothetical protein
MAAVLMRIYNKKYLTIQINNFIYELRAALIAHLLLEDRMIPSAYN